jgi:hypothetical protein
VPACGKGRLRTKGVLGSFFFRVELIFSNRNFFQNFYLKKLAQPIQSFFCTPFSEACLCRRQAKTVSKYIRWELHPYSNYLITQLPNSTLAL